MIVMIISLICGTVVACFCVFYKRCQHKWIEDDIVEVDHYNNGKKHTMPVYSTKVFFYRCSVCGIHKMKKFKY
jgi:hypothetical protein